MLLNGSQSIDYEPLLPTTNVSTQATPKGIKNATIDRRDN
jgi:hypothetical protein